MELLLVPLLAASSQAADLILTKIVLTRHRISIRDFNPVTFLCLFGFALLLWPFLGTADWDRLLTSQGLLRLVGIILIACCWNMLYYAAIKAEKANQAENIINLMPIVTVGLAWIITPASFDPRAGLAVAIGTVALLMGGYWTGRGWALSRYDVMMASAVVLIAVENILVSGLLQDSLLSPVSLYAIRTGVIALLFMAYYRPGIGHMSPGNLRWIAGTALLGEAMMLLRFYGLRDSGVITTSLLLILTPVMVYAASAKILHERLKRRQLAAAGILIVSVIYALTVS